MTNIVALRSDRPWQLGSSEKDALALVRAIHGVMEHLETASEQVLSSELPPPFKRDVMQGFATASQRLAEVSQDIAAEFPVGAVRR